MIQRYYLQQNRRRLSRPLFKKFGKPVQSSNEVYQWPADEWHLRHEELWTKVKTTFLSRSNPQAGSSGRGLYPSQVGGRIEALLSKPGSRYLDVGCGRKADWLCAMGDRFPFSEGIGIDTQPILSNFLPPSVCGELYDCSQGLPYPDEFFDVISHAYLLPFLIGGWTYEGLVSEIARCLKPGGVYFCFDKYTTSLLLEDGRPLETRFPFVEAFLRLSSFWGNPEAASKLSAKEYRFKPVVAATQAFESIVEDIIPTQAGRRNVDFEADLLGDLFYSISLHVVSQATWFLMRAGFSKEYSMRWQEGCQAEVKRMKSCEKGEGCYAQFHLVYAVKKEEEEGEV